MINQMIQVKDRVAEILEKYPETRDCDKLLWVAYLSLYCNLKETLGVQAYHNFKGMMRKSETPPMESIRRVRAKYQSDGKFRGEKYEKRLTKAHGVYDAFAGELKGEGDALS